MNTIDININVVLGVPNFKNKHLLFRGKWGEGVRISAIYLFRLCFSLIISL